MSQFIVYLSLVAFVSIATFIAYGVDKRQAGRGGRRIPERTLHLLALLGGWPGAIVGQKHFRHKTQKPSFLFVTWLIAGIHLSAAACVAYVRIASHAT